MYVRKVKPFNITLEADPDKSITHRALILGAAAEGVTKIFNPSLSVDCMSTASCLKKCGVKIFKSGGVFEIYGGIKNGEFLLNSGNSGTTLRLMTGLLAGKTGVTAYLTGDESLKKRPMGRITKPLNYMGAEIEFCGSPPENNIASIVKKNNVNSKELCEACGESGSLPIKITGKKLRGIEYSLPVPSAQLKSALLIAGLDAIGTTALSGETVSRNHTEIMLTAMGANLEISGNSIKLGPGKIRAADIEPAGDFSSAMYFLVLALLCRNSSVTIKKVNINPTRVAALELLKNCGAEIYISNEHREIETSADITAVCSRLKPFKITADTARQMIDELPLLATAACFIEGDSIIEGAAELRFKESDRIAAIAEGLTKMGADIDMLSDGMIIHGQGKLDGGCSVSSFLDHRIEMSLIIAAALSKGGAEVESGYAAISFPGFYKLLDRITA